MKGQLNNCFLYAVILLFITANAGAQSTANTNYGIWQSTSEQIKVFSEISGRLTNFNWKDIEVSPNVWTWKSFDSTFSALSNDGLPFVFMIYTKEDAPDWLYTNGVPKVIVKDASGVVNGYAPYYLNADYNFYFKRMITTVRQHVESLSASVRNKVVGVQACFGSTGDPISYKGTVDPQYDLTNAQFDSLFQVFSAYYYNEYKNTSPKIYLLSNTANDGDVDMAWLMDNCPGGWIKTGSLGKGFQLNDEKTKTGWLYPIMNSPQSGEYVRSRSEITGGTTSTGWWLKMPYKNMYALMCYGIYWGLDMGNQGIGELSDPLYDSSFSFFNKYAKAGSQKDAAKSTNALCAFKDVLDASDGVRFPAATYGTIDRTNVQRYQNIVNSYSAFGARLEDTGSATAIESVNLTATGTNDVGWDLLPGNYERDLYQITPNATSVGYWNVTSSDANSMYGKYARGFDIPNNKKAFYFDVDSSFLNYAPLNGKYSVTVDITYLDDNDGSWQVYYDSKNVTDKSSVLITGTKTNKWKKVSVTLSDAYFGNRGPSGSDFSIRSVNNKKVLFSTVELSRSASSVTNINLYATAMPVFDSICINGTAPVKSFILYGAALDGTRVTVGPLTGYTFSTSSTGTFTDSLIINNYGTAFTQNIFVKLKTTKAATYRTSLPVTGGGTGTLYLPLVATVISSSPALSANVTVLACKGDPNNGIIDLKTTGGTGPFTYSWTSVAIGYFKSTDQDLNSLKPGDYTVLVTSLTACTTTATYNITEPDALSIIFNLDSSIVCRDSNTTVTVTATGGNIPYNGIGTFVVGSGSKSYTVTDAKGCTKTQNYNVTNGTLKAPLKPGSITGDDADAKGICGNGSYVYSIAAVTDATSYTWAPPSKIIVASANASLTSATLNTTGSFTSGTLNVTAVNRCGSSPAATKTLTSTPGKPGSILGPVSVTAGKVGLVYTVSPAIEGLTYSWTATNGAKITAGQNTSSITVTWGSLAGKVIVLAKNNCQSSGNTSVDITIKTSKIAFAAVNGSVSESSSVTATDAADGKLPVLALMPNPAKDYALLVFNAKDHYKYIVEVTDLAGRLLQKKEINTTPGENRINIDVHSYTSGLYIVSLIDNNNRRKIIKLVKQ